KAILTRTGDYIIPLDRRSQIAENLRADAFVSIHVNSNRKRAVTGIEVYCESPKGAVGEAERLVAETENQQDYIGAITGPGAGTSRKTQIVQKQAATMFQSQQLAHRVENRMQTAVPGLSSRGVKRAGFKVLHSLNLPSILVELGYISNAAEANLLKIQNNQIRLAQSIYLGVRDFLENPPVQGYDSSYIAYVQAVEAEKRARAERIRKAQERRARMLANSIKYQVKKGETVAQIAAKFKVNQSDLRELNNLSKKSKLKAGQTLRVPRG
ncbi:MAG TPA: N-acetylmuramoyl-L-alanine amidase, partial [Candidatus Ozemobacteraceae bacterium]|nr:N-acetylmuramoyl-L-alanine amidase [Candidatus Ozemobacteraceae bacterium]